MPDNPISPGVHGPGPYYKQRWETLDEAHKEAANLMVGGLAATVAECTILRRCPPWVAVYLLAALAQTLVDTVGSNHPDLRLQEALEKALDDRATLADMPVGEAVQ